MPSSKMRLSRMWLNMTSFGVCEYLKLSRWYLGTVCPNRYRRLVKIYLYPGHLWWTHVWTLLLLSAVTPRELSPPRIHSILTTMWIYISFGWNANDVSLAQMYHLPESQQQELLDSCWTEILISQEFLYKNSVHQKLFPSNAHLSTNDS